MTVAESLSHILSTLPPDVHLVAVSKYHPTEAIMEAYEAGQRCFGENHVVEMAAKAAVLPTDIEWHFTGHVQTNKLRLMVPFVHTIESVDSWHALSEIDRHAARHGRVIHCLLQVHVAKEDTKFGLTPTALLSLLADEPWMSLTHVSIDGLMAMATNTDDEQQIHDEFRSVHELFNQVKDTYFADSEHFCQLSMGMTDDYPIAIAEGANIVRIGTAIFGTREY